MKWFRVAFWADVALIWGWWGLHVVVGDRLGIIAMLDMFAMFFFLPLIVALPVLVFRRERLLWASWGVSALLFVWLWYGLFVPMNGSAEVDGPVLRVMTYNVLGIHDDYDTLLENIRAARPDVVLMQEVNPEFARRVASELDSEYPYQILSPEPGVRGMGTISRYRIVPTGEDMGLVWIGAPQLMRMDWNGTAIALVNFHTLPPWLSREPALRRNVGIRDEEARALSDYARAQADTIPVIVAGDLNATDVSTAYGRVTEYLHDAWHDGGAGFGTTFPNTTAWRMRRIPIPKLVFRIDYIFLSRGLRAAAAFLGSSEGSSDHRGVVADVYIAAR